MVCIQASNSITTRIVAVSEATADNARCKLQRVVTFFGFRLLGGIAQQCNTLDCTAYSTLLSIHSFGVHYVICAPPSPGTKQRKQLMNTQRQQPKQARLQNCLLASETPPYSYSGHLVVENRHLETTK
jgi:hypothetical protein